MLQACFYATQGWTDAVSSKSIPSNEGNQAQKPKHLTRSQSMTPTVCIYVYQEGALSQVWYIKMGHGNGHGKIVSSTSEHMTSMFYSI